MRSLIDVLFHMGLKCTRLRKCLTTEFADVRTFTGLQIIEKKAKVYLKNQSQKMNILSHPLHVFAYAMLYGPSDGMPYCKQDTDTVSHYCAYSDGIAACRICETPSDTHHIYSFFRRYAFSHDP